MDIDKLIEYLMVTGELDDNFGLIEDDEEEEDIIIDNPIKKIKKKDNQDNYSK